MLFVGPHQTSAAVRLRYLLAILLCAAASIGQARAARYDDYLSGHRLIRVGLATGYDRVRILSDGPVRLARYPGGSSVLPPGVALQSAEATARALYSVRVGMLRSAEEMDELAVSLRRRGYQVQVSAAGSPLVLSILDIPTYRRAELIVKRLARTGVPGAEIVEPTTVTAGRTEVVIDTKSARGDLDLRGPLDIIPAADGHLSFRAYGDQKRPKQVEWSCPGKLRLIAGAKGVSVVAIMPLEQYLRGVVGREMPDDFEVEALKCQAIIARTWALSNLGRHAADGFDVCAGVHCQCYGGLGSYSPRADAAIAATRGQIITYNGRLCTAMYHAVCGGHTEDIESVCGIRDPSLRGIPDTPPGGSPLELGTRLALGGFLNSPGNAYCKASRRFRWEKAFTRRELYEIFSKTLPRLVSGNTRPLGKLLNIRVAQRSRRGRVQRLVVVGDSGTWELKDNDIRWAFGDGSMGTGLYSTLFVIRRFGGSKDRPERFEIFGGGWGHGVGLCQEGANGMAKAGYDYKSILRHYYTDVTISPLGG